jgi:tRNA pseudouridine55 synthase
MIKHKVNILTIDPSNHPEGILLLDKPIDMTSHDLVDKVRRVLKTQKVGHTGTLDPFATGLMIILIGKSTKLSDKFLGMHKEYNFDLLFGIETDTLDPEGKITNVKPTKKIKKNELERVLDSFKTNYFQYVPLHSSVKKNGLRLRELVRASDSYERYEKDKSEFVRFTFRTPSRIRNKLLKKRLLIKNSYTLEIPRRKVLISNIALKSLKTAKSDKIANITIQNNEIKNVYIANIKVTVSKGTYIRQFAKDIGVKVGQYPAMLLTLRRTKIGKYSLKDTVPIDTITKTIK